MIEDTLLVIISVIRTSALAPENHDIHSNIFNQYSLLIISPHFLIAKLKHFSQMYDKVTYDILLYLKY